MAIVAEVRVRDILADYTDLDGHALRITTPLDRSDYVAVNKVLEAMGGKWNRKAQAHIFPTDPGPALAQFLAGGAAPPPPRTAEGYVATPAAIADKVVRDHTEVWELPADARVLEPSAGDGSLVRAILAANPQVTVHAVEPNRQRMHALMRGGMPGNGHIVYSDTFEQWAAQDQGRFDAVVMNPPFALPGQATAWIDHVQLAWTLVAPGGRVTAIVPAGYRFREDRRHHGIRAMVQAHGGAADLPDDAFGGIRTVLIWMEKPHDPNYTVTCNGAINRPDPSPSLAAAPPQPALF